MGVVRARELLESVGLGDRLVPIVRKKSGETSAVSAISRSARDLPMAIPWAWRKVLAMPPPMTRTSTLLSRLPRIWICSGCRST